MTLAEAIPQTLAARWLTVAGMMGLAAGGLLFASGEVRNAIVFAAVAAVVIDLVAGVADRVRSASDRELAAETVGGAATAVLDGLIQFSEGAGPMTEEIPELTLRAIGNGSRLFTNVHDPASLIERARDRLFRNRQLYAASAGTQVVLLDDRARRVAVDAQRELDAAIIALDRLREAEWRHQTLRLHARGKPLEAYRDTDLVPRSVRFHDLAGRAAALLLWLEQPRGRPPQRYVAAPADGQLPLRRTEAARAIVADAIDVVVRSGGRPGNWINYSSLAAVREPSLNDIAALGDLIFHGQGIGNGWSSLQSGLREEMRLLASILDIVEVDLEPAELASARRLVAQLGDVAAAAGKASDAEDADIDAGVKQLAADQIKAAHEVFEGRRQAFLRALRVALEMMRAIRSDRPAGFGPDEPSI